MQIFLNDDSGSEFEGFMLADLCELVDNREANVEQDFDSENKIPDEIKYSHPWLVEFSEVFVCLFIFPLNKIS